MLYVGVDGVFEIVSDGDGVIGVFVVDGGEFTGGPLGGLPVTVAEFATAPAFTSAWVIVCVPVHVVDALGASVVATHVAAASRFTSLMTMPVSVTLPVFVTLKL